MITATKMAIVCTTLVCFNMPTSFRITDLSTPQMLYESVWEDESLGYRIGQYGDIRYLIDEDGKNIGGGYHGYRKNENGSITGILGNNIKEIVIADNGDVYNDGGAKKYSYEELKTLKALYFLGGNYEIKECKNGAKFIYNKKNKKESNCYFSFYDINGVVYGQYGGLKEPVVSNSGNIINYGGFNRW